jgi:hypothetical protein
VVLTVTDNCTGAAVALACMAGWQHIIRAYYTDCDIGYSEAIGNGYLACVGCDILRIVALLLKCLGMALIHFNLLTDAAQPMIMTLGKLAMADVFILALYIVIAKGIGVGQIEVSWGLYLFTAAVLTSLGISLLPKRKN